MKEGQNSIYYMAADSKQAAENAPFTEQLVAKGFEVLICYTHHVQTLPFNLKDISHNHYSLYSSLHLNIIFSNHVYCNSYMSIICIYNIHIHYILYML